MKEISKIMTATGARRPPFEENSISVREAVDCAVEWFEGKMCLFLVDDVWPTAGSKTGFFSDLRQLVRCSTQSRMAISTRSTDIALEAGSVVNFGVRDPTGPVSERMFMRYASLTAHSNSPLERSGSPWRSVSRVLSQCGGLPIAISVAGCAVRLKRLHSSLETACNVYADELQNKRASLGHTEISGGTSFNTRIQLSLDYLDAAFKDWKAQYAPEAKQNISDIYISLCVLKKQTWVPVSVLSRFWKLNKDCTMTIVELLSGLSLASLESRNENREDVGSGVSEVGLALHDLLLEFCQDQARREKKTTFWHDKLLDGYVAADVRLPLLYSYQDSHQVQMQSLLTYTPRPWSETLPDGYIQDNISRHLVGAGRILELGALLLDAKWTIARMRIGGINALKSDFDCLLSAAVGRFSEEVRKGFEVIVKVLRLSWGRSFRSRREFQFQVMGRLVEQSRQNAVVNKYVQSMASHMEKPYLAPVSSIFLDPSSLAMEVPVGKKCFSVSCSPCGKYVAFAGDRDVVVMDFSTGAIIKRLNQHTEDVLSVTFAFGSESVISGSKDKTVLLWTWETSVSAVQISKGTPIG